ncbi:hypothetical protein Tco_1005365 [Tanacetum coccineum]|uniref:Uncharacterized protein n=1 Tax=Tanacetum coccineum TaxID=301880 RepID=A0ABQ5FEY4_9ASTR
MLQTFMNPDEEPKEEPKQEAEFAPFAQAAQDNMNSWFEKDDEEDEMEAEEAKEVEVEIDDDEDDAEVIHPYEEDDPLNKPPPDLDTKPEVVAVATAPTPASHATLQPLPPLHRFSGTFYTGDGSSATPFNAKNCKVYAPGPLGKNMDALHSKVKTLARQMKDRSDNEIKIQKKFKSSDLRMNNFDYDLSTLDLTLRE